MKCSVTFTGQSKATTTTVKIETDSTEDINTEQSNATVEEAKRVYEEADKYAHIKTLQKQR